MSETSKLAPRIVPVETAEPIRPFGLDMKVDLFNSSYVPKSAINWNDADNNNAFHAKQLVADFNGSLSMELGPDFQQGRI